MCTVRPVATSQHVLNIIGNQDVTPTAYEFIPLDPLIYLLTPGAAIRFHFDSMIIVGYQPCPI